MNLIFKVTMDEPATQLCNATNALRLSASTHPLPSSTMCGFVELGGLWWLQTPAEEDHKLQLCFDGKRDTKQFQQAKQRFAMKQRELEHNKEQYDQKRRAVSTGATHGFLDRFVQIMAHTPHAKLPSKLLVKVSARVEEICKYVR